MSKEQIQKSWEKYMATHVKPLVEQGIGPNDHRLRLAQNPDNPVQRELKTQLEKFDFQTTEKMCEQGIPPTCATGLEFMQCINKFPDLFSSQIRDKTPKLTKEGIPIAGQKCTSYQLRTLNLPITISELEEHLISESSEVIKPKNQIEVINLANITEIPEDIIRKISEYIQHQMNGTALEKIPEVSHQTRNMSHKILNSPYLTDEEKQQFKTAHQALQQRFDDHKKRELNKLQLLQDAINSI